MDENTSDYTSSSKFSVTFPTRINHEETKGMKEERKKS